MCADDKNKKLYDFFKKLDRAYFIDNEYKAMASFDTALPIGHGQTISQPSLVAKMTELLDIESIHRVLEIGTGSGYQTAFLCEFAGEVYTVELIRELAEKAKDRLTSLGYKNVWFKTGDGSEGWREFAPYDRIMVTAGGGCIPPPLIEQLKPGGRLLMPVGKRGLQDLVLAKKDLKGNVTEESILKVAFVELVGKYGYD